MIDTEQRICTNGYDCIAHEHDKNCAAKRNEELSKWEPEDGEL